MGNSLRVLVTGASRGIGRAVALRLAGEGHDVFCAGRDVAALKELARAHRDHLTVAVGDLVNPAQRAALVPSAVRELGGLDVLVQCAGIVRYEAAGAIAPASLAAQVEVNLTAPILVAQAALPALRESGGAIVNIASTLATHPAPHTAVYAATKAAMIAWSRTFAAELAPDVRVNCVSPGVVDTDMIRAQRPDGADPDAQLAALRRLHPMGRLGHPEDVADAVLYLMSSRWITGANLVVDGGLTLG